MLCFETECAGLLEHFPCLGVRGIADYADTHKNDDWHGYASIAAAAYAKDLLLRVGPAQVEAQRTAAELLKSSYSCKQGAG
ncbi:pfs domain-containing protein [Stagonosporopsis vannaccii]|nr:pfs domain-containing protein [Stagonosporopsis vannaccii]